MRHQVLGNTKYCIRQFLSVNGKKCPVKAMQSVVAFLINNKAKRQMNLLTPQLPSMIFVKVYG